MFPIALSIDPVRFEAAFPEFERCNLEVSIGSPAAGVLFIHDPAGLIFAKWTRSSQVFWKLFAFTLWL